MRIIIRRVHVIEFYHFPINRLEIYDKMLLALYILASYCRILPLHATICEIRSPNNHDVLSIALSGR